MAGSPTHSEDFLESSGAGEIHTGTVGRACDACHKKKTKCDMQQPICGLCQRTKQTCHFPSTRKRPSRHPPSDRSKAQKLNHSDDLTNHYMQQPPSYNPTPQSGMLLPTFPSALHFSGHLSPPDSPVGAQQATTTDSAVITHSLAMHLLDIYFDKIQPWLGLFHKPTFLEYSSRVLARGEIALNELSAHEAMRFYSMFALAARFSNHPSLALLRPKDRGQSFIRKAESYYKLSQDSDEYTLAFVQACVMLVIYRYAAGSTKTVWPISLVLVRACYELGLNQIDEEDEEDERHDGGRPDWIELEMQRRAFWATWEIDTLRAIIKRKPFTIDWRHIQVKVPVSDDAWFAGIITDSPRFIPGHDCWKTLIETPNQHERAWALIAKAIVAQTIDLTMFKEGVSAEQKSIMENTISCFKFAMPEIFQPSSAAWVAADLAPTQRNFIISANLHLSTASLVVSLIPIRGEPPNALHHTARNARYRARVLELSDILRTWPPDHIAYAHPSLACTILTYDESLIKLIPSSDFFESYKDLSRLILAKFAEFWNLGAVLLRVVDIAHSYHTSDAAARAELVKQWPIYFDRKMRNESKKTAAFIDASTNPSTTDGPPPEDYFKSQGVNDQSVPSTSPDVFGSVDGGLQMTAPSFDPTQLQDLSSVPSLGQSPEELDAMFSGFMPEPAWQEFSFLNYLD